MSDQTRYWVVIPAAGVGTRMELDKPKQYISINDKTVIEHTIACFISRSDIAGIVVVIATADEYWSALKLANNAKITVAPGGKERFQSVLNGLNALSTRAGINDWVLVHDAARPCLSQQLIDRLIEQTNNHDVGGILALPCRDTIKRANDSGEIESTVDRNKLWQAQTPQMFRYEKLVNALSRVVTEGNLVTDEAMAMELAGYNPLLVEGHPDNIKLTQKDDLGNVEAYLDKVR